MAACPGLRRGGAGYEAGAGLLAVLVAPLPDLSVEPRTSQSSRSSSRGPTISSVLAFPPIPTQAWRTASPIAGVLSDDKFSTAVRSAAHRPPKPWMPYPLLRSRAAVSESAGKNDSMASSETATSGGVPKVVTVLRRASSSLGRERSVE